MVPKLLDMLQPPAVPTSLLSPKTPMSRAVSITQEAAVHALLGKEGDVAQYTDAAFDRVPDQVNLDVVIAAPRLQIPVQAQ